MPRHAEDLLQRMAGVLGAAREQPFKAQQRLGDAPTGVQLANQIGARHPHLVKEHFAEFLVAGQRPDRAPTDAGAGKVNQQETDARLLFDGLVGAHQHEHVGGVLRQRGPGLLAGDDKVAAVHHRLAAQGRQV
ncbi:hypothetical protein D3C73_1251990 [compost metagenome]